MSEGTDTTAAKTTVDEDKDVTKVEVKESGHGASLRPARSQSGKTRMELADEEWEEEQARIEQRRKTEGDNPKTVTIGGHIHYIVEQVLDERLRNGKRQLHIKWQGYGEAHNTWEPFENIPDVSVTEFMDKRRAESREGMKDRHSQKDLLFNYESVDVIVNEADKEYVDEGITKFAANVIEGLKNQFPGDTSSILAAMDIFHLDSLPSDEDKWTKQRDNYGMEEVKLLTSHFGEFVAPGPPPMYETESQWKWLRDEMWEHKNDLLSHPDKMLDKETGGKKSWKVLTDEFWADQLCKPGPLNYELVLRLVAIFLVVVLSSVPCERYFRKMNLQKDLLKTRMDTTVLDDRMMIAENGPECDEKSKIEIIIQMALQIWLSRKKRNPNMSRQQARPERRKRRKMEGLSGLRLERGYESDDSSSDEDTDSKCLCTFRPNQVEKDMEFEPRGVLVPEEGWKGVQISSINMRETIQSAMRSYDFRIAIQYPTGWNLTGQIVQVEQGLCEHLRDYKGWVWVRMLQEGESTKSVHLRALDVERYGMDSQCSWCLLKRDDS